MKFECIGVTGFAGDRTPEAMIECHPFTNALSEFLNVPVSLYGHAGSPKDLPWNDALIESYDVFSTVARVVNESLDRGCAPILITPRCASAIASLPVVISKFPDALILYFDAHGDLNLPESSASGYLGGMPITAAMGEWDSGYGSGLHAKNLVHIGGRDLDLEEHDFIRANKITTVSKRQLESDLDQLTDLIRGRAVYIHIDTDVYDPSEVVAEYSVADGLFARHVKDVIRLVLAEGCLLGLEITELSPKDSFEREHSYKALFNSLNPLSEPVR